jgi:hypothetical protein
VQIDHVLIAVADLDSAARDFEERYGLVVLDGGRHPGVGTANRIVPLGDAYLELIAVVDDAEAQTSALSRRVAGARDGELIGWAARTQDIDADAARLGLEVVGGARRRPDGRVIEWRTAGLETAAAEPCLPFFIQWADGAALPGAAAEDVPALTRLELTGDAERIAGWLGGDVARVTVQPGGPAVARIAVGDVVIA